MFLLGTTILIIIFNNFIIWSKLSFRCQTPLVSCKFLFCVFINIEMLFLLRCWLKPTFTLIKDVIFYYNKVLLYSLFFDCWSSSNLVSNTVQSTQPAMLTCRAEKDWAYHTYVTSIIQWNVLLYIIVKNAQICIQVTVAQYMRHQDVNPKAKQRLLAQD